MGMEYRTHGRDEKYTKFYQKPEGKNHWEDPRIGRMIKLEWVLD
jgi:hypothetical protein